MSTVVAKLDEAVTAIRARAPRHEPTLGVVLGSGLGAWGDALESRTVIPYGQVPGMPRSAVAGHSGNLILGVAEDVPVVCLQGRVHLYEGHDPERVVFGVRLLARLGCKAVLLTNAAGGLHPEMTPGDLMLVTDHLNLTGRNPLVGPNDDVLGPRFPDMTQAYDGRLRRMALTAAAELGSKLREGVYAGLLGPTYETPAEIAMLRRLGADAVGMSTVHEVIALRHMRVRAAAISCITNMAAGMTGAELSHTEVEETANKSRDRFVALLSRWVRLTSNAVQAPPSVRGTMG